MNEPWQGKAHILVVDDDDRLRALLRRYLGEQGFMVSTASDVREAEELLSYLAFDLMVLDVMMPGERGTDWLARSAPALPVLMLSALGEADDRIAGLEVGAEDYLAKPFEPKELVLRIKSILRRSGEQKERRKWVGFGEYRFDMDSGQLKRGREVIALSSSEAEMLKVLAAQAGKPASREELAKLLPAGSNERSVDVQMSRLRKKIEGGEGRAAHIQTVRGAGYVLHVD